MKAKNGKKYILGLLIVIIMISGFLYVKYTTFTSSSITHLQIIEGSQTVLDQFDFGNTTLYTAYDQRKETEDIRNVNYDSENPLFLRLINQLNNKITYEIMNINEKGFILKNSKDATYILVPHSTLISSSKALIQYYPELMPSNLTLNQTPLTSTTLNTWSYFSYDSRWISLSEAEWDHTEAHQMNLFDLQGENIHLDFKSDKPYTLGMLKIIDSNDDQIIYEDELESNMLFIPEYDGTFIYHLQLIYNDNTSYKGDLTTEFTVKVDRPIKVTLIKDQIEQGDYTILSIQYASEQDHFTIEQLPYEILFFKSNHNLKAILYADYRTKIGKYPFVVKSTTRDTSWPFEYEIVPRKFHIQHLIIDETIAKTTKNDNANAEFAEKYTPLRKQSSDEDFTTGDYLIPTTGRLSTEYGETRYVNGSPTSYRHSGLDIAAPRGTPVYATNSGKVLLATPLILTGNTILIDHGQGIFSTYFHLDKLTITEGQMVTKGALIGEVGTTGFSTGPHLHFIISYYEHNLEPGYFLVNEPITYSNYKTFIK
ncbi:M23 family metallopeptidase [Fusibacter sp. 3D3]|uniref:M23 family metallopeptidase n=1 Tax=Fusibacter sp. 3D3 TaxID=1048380 RepID=UPI000852DD56|nr:M23 family metallopeptidase [Fusibacter sp. 3D3]GAU77072.1 peptidase [Fusibacter sp. 3D3]